MATGLPLFLHTSEGSRMERQHKQGESFLSTGADTCLGSGCQGRVTLRLPEDIKSLFRLLTTHPLFWVSSCTVIFRYWSSFRSSKVAEIRESSPKRQTSQVRREMPLNARKPNFSSSSGLAARNHTLRELGKWLSHKDPCRGKLSDQEDILLHGTHVYSDQWKDEKQGG